METKICEFCGNIAKKEINGIPLCYECYELSKDTADILIWSKIVELKEKGELPFNLATYLAFLNLHLDTSESGHFEVVTEKQLENETIDDLPEILIAEILLEVGLIAEYNLPIYNSNYELTGKVRVFVLNKNLNYEL